MVLQVVKMGCDFSPKYNPEEYAFSDLQNHRLRMRFVDKDGLRIYGDVSCWKQPINKQRNFIAIHPDFSKHGTFEYCHSIQHGTFSYRTDIDTRRIPYRITGLLALINSLSKEEYDSVEFVAENKANETLEEWTKWFEEEV